MAKVHLLEVEAKCRRLELEKSRDALVLAQENQKIAEATAAAAVAAASAPPAREVETVSRNSVSSLVRTTNPVKCVRWLQVLYR